MNDDDHQKLAVALQSALRRQTLSVNLSRAASLIETGFILPVVRSLRTACLLSVLTASQSVLNALQDALLQSKGVSVAVHEASEQIFVINRALFVKRWSDAIEGNLYYAVDADGREEHERIKTTMPHPLRSLLSELYHKLPSRSLSGSPEVISLNSVNGDIHGVALAGWLLEYDVVYHFEGTISSTNCLAGMPLILIIVKANNKTLYQYTIPLSAANALYETSMQEICHSIEMRLAGRTPTNTFEATHQSITVDRVAL